MLRRPDSPNLAGLDGPFPLTSSHAFPPFAQRGADFFLSQLMAGFRMALPLARP